MTKRDRREYLRQYYQNNKKRCDENQLKYRKKNWDKIRQYTLEYERKAKKNLVHKLGSKCAYCGIIATDDNLCIFDFHHLNPEEKERSREWINKNFDISKVILLCANCHRIETQKRRDFKRKELSMLILGKPL
jgi:predicted HNH restriction endonuclease